MESVWKSPFVRLVGYYVVLGLAVVLLIAVFPRILDTYQTFRDLGALSSPNITKGAALNDVANRPGIASLGSGPIALISLLTMLGALALVVPVAWVYMTTKQHRGYDQSVVQTVLVLPMTVAGTLILVQNSLALAFALGGIVATIRFRNTLKDTKDVVYIYLALGVGLAAGVFVPAVAAVMSFVFNLTILVLWRLNVGNVYADQWLLPGRLRLGQALLGPGPTGEFRAIGDPALLAALSPEELQEVAHRSARLRQYIEARAGVKKKKRFNGLVLVHVAELDQAQKAVEQLLEEGTERWKLAEIQPGPDGKSTLEYLVRLADTAFPGTVLEALKTRLAPHVLGAEFRSLRGLGKQ